MAKPSETASTPRQPQNKQTTVHHQRPGALNMPSISQSTRPPKRFKSVTSDDGASGPVTSSNYTAPHKRTMAFASPVRRPPSRDLGYDPHASTADNESRATSTDTAPIAPMANMAPVAPMAPMDLDSPTPQPEDPEEPATIRGSIWNTVRSAFGAGGNAVPDPTSPSALAGRKRAFKDVDESEDSATDKIVPKAASAEPVTSYSATVSKSVVEEEGPAGDSIVATEEAVVEEVEIKANSTAVELEDQLRGSEDGADESAGSDRDGPATAETNDAVEEDAGEVDGAETEEVGQADGAAAEDVDMEETDEPEAEAPAASKTPVKDDSPDAEVENGVEAEEANDNEAEVFEIKEIRDHRQSDDDSTLFELRVEWNTADPTDQYSWEPEANVQEDAPAALWKYWRSVKGGRAAAMADPDMWHVLDVAGHKVKPDGSVLVQVAWIGSAQKSWEPEEAVADYGAEHLEEYWEKQGGREKVMGAKGKVAKKAAPKTTAKKAVTKKAAAKTAAATAAPTAKATRKAAPRTKIAAAEAAPKAKATVGKSAPVKAAPAKTAKTGPKATAKATPATRATRTTRAAEPIEPVKPAPAKRKATTAPKAAPAPASKEAKEAPPPARSTRSRRT